MASGTAVNQAFSGSVIVDEIDDVPPTKESVAPKDSGDDGGKDLGLSYDLLDTRGSPTIYSLWAHLASKAFESAVKRIEKNTSDRGDSFFESAVNKDDWHLTAIEVHTSGRSYA